MYSSLDALLALALIERNHEKKEGKKVLVKMRKKFDLGVQNGIIKDALDMGVPAACDQHYIRWATLQNTGNLLADMGAMGMVIVTEMKGRNREEQALPVFIHINTKEDRDWARQNEEEIVTAAAAAAMRTIGLKELDCFIIMFTNFGFSGERHRRTVALGPEALAMRKAAGL